MRGRFVTGLLVSAGFFGCNGPAEQATKYRIQVRCLLMPDDKPISGVQLRGATPAPVACDAAGKAVLDVEGIEGREVSFEVTDVPASLALADGKARRSVVLKNYGARDAQKTGDISHEIRFRSRKETYVVLVYAEQAPGVAVAASNASEPVASLNSKSAAAFLTEGKPGDELSVTLLAGRAEGQKGADPSKTFTLQEGENLLAFHSDLFIKPAAPPRKQKPRAPKKENTDLIITGLDGTAGKARVPGEPGSR